MFIVCEERKNGELFPVHFDPVSRSKAAQTVAWMQIGQGEFENWRAIPVYDVREAAKSGKLALSIFTEKARSEFLDFLLNH